MKEELRDALRGTDADVTRSGTLLTFADDSLEERWDALGSTKARRIFNLLQSETLPPPDIANELDLSSQTVHYHLGRLVDADLVSVVGHGYSEKGKEMDIYAADHDPLVVASTSGSGTDIRQNLAEYITAGMAFTLLSVLIGFAVNFFWTSDSSDSTGVEPAFVGELRSAGDAGLSILPLVVFIAGGLTALLLLWVVREYSSS
jgi:DNA-binding transcriptional ArsR family regulator